MTIDPLKKAHTLVYFFMFGDLVKIPFSHIELGA